VARLGRLTDNASFFPRILHYITIPVHKNAAILPSASADGRWPVLVFSHGLGGNRNTYSHLCGSVASHGVVVVTPEHRDGSAPVSYMRDPSDPLTRTSRTVQYERADHTPTPEVHALRTAQLQTRLWELGLLHDALLRVDAGAGAALSNLNASSAALLPMFKGRLAVREPGSVAFGGHSFGAATVAQFVKSVYYSPYPGAPAEFEALYDPAPASEVKRQITARTPLILLDIWLLPLRAPRTRWLWNQPLPCYAAAGRGGAGVVAVESQVFFRWRVHLKLTKRFLSADPGSARADLDALDGRAGPRLYWAERSAHLSQSDFGILFPWVTRRMGGEEGERVMGLNVRAVVEGLREAGWAVKGEEEGEGGIFNTSGEIRGWQSLSLDVSDLQDVGKEEEEETVEHGQGQSAVGGDMEDVEKSPTELVVEDEALGRDGTRESVSGSGKL